MTVRSATDTSPTDLDLMRYADGELEGEQRAAVEAWLTGAFTMGKPPPDASRPPDAPHAPRAKLAALGVVSSVVREGARAASDRADGIADAVMARIDLAERSPAPVDLGLPRSTAPANDTSGRRYLGIAAICAAAAVALLVWGRAADPPVPTPVAAPEGEDVHGVEVSAVDFGARTGAVLYVPTGSSPSGTTTVVWLSDDDTTEEGGE
jgi:hypothetical protein